MNKRIIIILITISFLLLGCGYYLYYISNPKKIILTAISNLETNILDLLNDTSTETGINQEFSIDSTITIKAESSSYDKKSTIDNNYKEKNNLLNNLTRTKNNLKIVNSKKNNQLLIDINTTLDNKSIYKEKYLIQNSTKYHYYDKVNNNYINAGNNTYFESINNENNIIDNLKYLSKYTVKSLVNNLSENYYTKKYKTITIDSKDIDCSLISIELNSINDNELFNSILKDLQNDEMANTILSGFDSDFSKKKVTTKTTFLKKGEQIILNIYTDKFLYKIKKYELIYTDGKDTYNLTFYSNNIGSIVKNDKVLYYYNYEQKSNSKSINISNSNDEKIGTISFNYEPKNYVIDFNINDDNSIIGSYSSKITDIKKNKSYYNQKQLEFRYTKKKEEIINLSISIDSNVDNKSRIDEDVSSSVLLSSLTSEESKIFNDRYINVINNLKGSNINGN